MLRHLSIRNIVLVAEADIPFGPGLNALTGETGAGKSILLDAMGLVFGERSDAGLLRQGAAQASVTAEFAVVGRRDVVALLAQLGIEAGEALILRRTLDASGRSRAFVNDTAVTAGVLKQIAALLVEQHSQHDARGLMDAVAQRDTLDRIAGAGKQREAVAQAYHAWREAQEALGQLQGRIQQAERERAFLQHMVEELNGLSPQPGEEERLSEARARMQAQVKAQEQLASVLAALQHPVPMARQVQQAARMLERSGLPDAAMQQALLDAMGRAWAELEEVEAQLEAQLAAAPDDAVLESSEERLFALRAAARKYRTSVEGLAEEFVAAQQKLGELESQEVHLAAVEKRIVAAEAAYGDAAGALRAKREAAAEPFARAVMKELKPLKLDSARMAVRLEPLPKEQWGPAGCERVQFEASMNPGVAMAPIAGIASGGELSRLMLALKVVMRKAEQPGLYLFDEIDTGTGGAVADAIGGRLKALAQGGQVIVVTHAPQVAAQAGHHLHIRKQVKGGKTQTQVELLDEAARQDELARMLSGSEVTDEARIAARRLLQVGA